MPGHRDDGVPQLREQGAEPAADEPRGSGDRDAQGRTGGQVTVRVPEGAGIGHGFKSSLRSVAQRVSSCLDDSCSFRRTLDTWVSTVFTEMYSSEATSL